MVTKEAHKTKERGVCVCVCCIVFMKWELAKPLVSCPAHSRNSIHKYIIVMKKKKEGEKGKEKGVDGGREG